MKEELTKEVSQLINNCDINDNVKALLFDEISSLNNENMIELLLEEMNNDMSNEDLFELLLEDLYNY